MIPNPPISEPKENLDHLKNSERTLFESLLEENKSMFSRHKHHIGKFKYWSAKAEMNPAINCKQRQRSKIIPESAKTDLNAYKTAVLETQTNIAAI